MFIIGTSTLFTGNSELVQLKDAGALLNRMVGPFAMVAFALGLFSSGQSSTIAGVLTGQYIMEGFLNIKINKQVRVIVSRLINLLPCLIITRYLDIEWVYIMLNILQVVQLPFVLIPLFKFVQNKNIVGANELPKNKLKLLKLMSGVFLIMNIGQVINSVPDSTNYVVLFIVLIGLYLWVIWRLWSIKIKDPVMANNLTDSMELQSVEC